MRFLLSLLICFSAKAQNDAEVLFQKYREIKGDILNQEESKRKVLADLFKVTVGMKKINKRRELLMNEKNFVETRIQETASALEKLKQDLDSQRELLRSRMRGLYKFNGQNVMRLIFSSQTPADLDRNLKIIKIMADKDYILIRSYEKNLTVYSRETKKLEGHERRLVAIEAELKVHEGELLAQQEEKNRIVEGFDRATITQLIRLERIREQSSIISQAQSDPALRISQSFFEAKGRLVPPVLGDLIQGYGDVETTIPGTKLTSKGMYWSVSPNSQVKSIFSGEVVYAESVNGFGKILILSHGDHYYTIYGNASSLLVKKGQKVGSGEAIATSGHRWREKPSGIYFEIRHFSDPLDPEQWFENSMVTKEDQQVSFAEGDNSGSNL